MKTFAAMGVVLLMSAPLMQVAEAKEPAFKKLEGKARFIDGDNLVTGVMPESTAQRSAAPRSDAQRAAGLSTVMVTREGDVYESTVDPEDVAIFEQAIQDLELLGRTPTVAGTAPTSPGAAGASRVTPNVVIGADGRVRVTNTTVSPYSTIGRIGIGCTGTLITARHVLTAGHCVSNGAGQFYSSLDFSAGQDGSYKPWGTTSWKRALTPAAYHNGGDTNFDYALIVLNAAPNGGNAGWGVYSGGTHVIAGYPGDKPLGTMWRHSGAVSTSGSYRLCYQIDTAGGNSGSGIAGSGDSYVRGIHTTGSSTQNCGTRLTSTVYNTLQNWISANP